MLFIQKALISATVLGCIGLSLFSQVVIADPVVIDHNTTDITQIPQIAIEQAKSTLHIAYGHTSHGSQLTAGMTGLVGFANDGGLGLDLPEDLFAWNNGGLDGALDLEEGDGYGDGWLDHDAGYYPQWVEETRAYLDDSSHADTNVIIWSWCGQLSSYTEQELIDQYLTPMSQLETDYPTVTFVYMTGHADGSGETGNLHLRNQQIRNYCINNDKVLYDFYDIECYDPDGNYFGDKWVDDACNYDSDGDGIIDGNWATEWQDTHVESIDWYDCTSAHSQPLNANRKAYAAWWLWATLGGWDSDSEDSVDQCPDDPEKTSPGVCGCGVADTDSDNDGAMDCEDLCPDDPQKIQPGYCGCANTEDSCDPSDVEQSAMYTLSDGSLVTCRIYSTGSITLNEVTEDDDSLDALYPAILTTISGVGVGETIRLDIEYPDIPDGYDIYQYSVNTWQDISDDAHLAIDYENAVVTMYLTDGEFGDADGIENGKILNTSVIAKQASADSDTDSSSQSGGGGGGGCFIGVGLEIW